MKSFVDVSNYCIQLSLKRRRAIFNLRKSKNLGDKNLKYTTNYFIQRKQHALLTCQPQRGHPLELRLLEPLPHPPERLPPRLELRPRLRVPQQVAERSLRPTQHPLREYRLRYRVPLQFPTYPLRQLFGVDFFCVVLCLLLLRLFLSCHQRRIEVQPGRGQRRRRRPPLKRTGRGAPSAVRRLG